MMIKTIFSVLPKVMKSVLPKVSAQSVEGVRFLDVAWSDAFGVALSDAGAGKSPCSDTLTWKDANVFFYVDYVDQTVEATPNSSELARCSWSSQVLDPPKADCLNKAIPDTC